MDPLIVQSYQIGIVLGILILSTLILFPGRKETAASRDDPLTNDDPTSSRTTSNRSRKVKDNDDTGMVQQQYWTPHRRLNAVVYIFILVVLFYVLLYSYTDHSVPHHRQQLQHPTTLLKVLFKTYFPKEAALVWK